jgi:SAM-dependent methyltransferase
MRHGTYHFWRTRASDAAEYDYLHPRAILEDCVKARLPPEGDAMLNAEQLRDAPLNAQIEFWNRWNAEEREAAISQVSIDQRDLVVGWLEGMGRRDLKILEVGCGAGWLCGRLTKYGSLTATDLSNHVLQRAAARLPDVKFVAGDFMSLDFDSSGYDVVVSLEVLSHVADQPAFIRKMSSLLKPGGFLMLATQNRPQLERNDIPNPKPGQIRLWVDRHKLAGLIGTELEIRSLFSITPQCNRGVLRVINSGKLHSAMATVGLGQVGRAVKRLQENMWLGWTLMCLAQKPQAARA